MTGTIQYNAKMAQLEQENALLYQQLEWQPKSQLSQSQQEQWASQNQIIKPQ